VHAAATVRPCGPAQTVGGLGLNLAIVRL